MYSLPNKKDTEKKMCIRVSGFFFTDTKVDIFVEIL
jgi:hypothetical protein